MYVVLCKSYYTWIVIYHLQANLQPIQYIYSLEVKHCTSCKHNEYTYNTLYHVLSMYKFSLKYWMISTKSVQIHQPETVQNSPAVSHSRIRTIALSAFRFGTSSGRLSRPNPIMQILSVLFSRSHGKKTEKVALGESRLSITVVVLSLFSLMCLPAARKHAWKWKLDHSVNVKPSINDNDYSMSAYVCIVSLLA